PGKLALKPGHPDESRKPGNSRQKWKAVPRGVLRNDGPENQTGPEPVVHFLPGAAAVFIQPARESGMARQESDRRPGQGGGQQLPWMDNDLQPRISSMVFGG